MTNIFFRKAYDEIKNSKLLGCPAINLDARMATMALLNPKGFRKYTTKDVVSSRGMKRRAFLKQYWERVANAKTTKKLIKRKRATRNTNS